MKRVLPADVSKRVASICAEYGLAEGTSAKFEALLHAMEDEHAPTSIHSPREGVDVHIADSLAALSVEGIRSAGLIADIGSGGGMPALALAASMPTVEISAIESIGRKCEFISASAASAGISNCTAVWTRAEQWTDGIGRCDFVTARALAALPVLAEYSAPLLKMGGSLVAWKADISDLELDAGRRAADELGLTSPEVVIPPSWPGAGERKLLVLTKVAETPSRYPRRAGIALKRPLGG
jgi:16S rRNA (guanine527-N7)-methyltransferase